MAEGEKQLEVKKGSLNQTCRLGPASAANELGHLDLHFFTRTMSCSDKMISQAPSDFKIPQGQSCHACHLPMLKFLG